MLTLLEVHRVEGHLPRLDEVLTRGTLVEKKAQLETRPQVIASDNSVEETGFSGGAKAASISIERPFHLLMDPVS